MKNLPLDEARCHGRETRANPTICPHRNSCERHLQIERDRDLKLPDSVPRMVMDIGFVPGNSCHYFRAAS